jgi:membrane associated rhomboid family serine protease
VIPLHDNVPTRAFPIVTVALIAANAIVWLWEFTGTPVQQDVYGYGYYPCLVDGPCTAFAARVHEIPWYENVFTSMFMHGSWEHIIGNMLFLWIFGNNVEDALGRVRFLIWYILAGLAATAAQTVVTIAAGTVRDASVPNIGASGAIAGVLGAYFVLLPRARVLTAFIIIFIPILREIPAVWFLGIWIGLQIYEGGLGLLAPQSSGGVAFFAHIGGFVFGVATVKLVAKRRPAAPPQPRWLY